jgi:hypothetical protein
VVGLAILYTTVSGDSITALLPQVRVRVRVLGLQ